jgi:arabinose-5-phosphate isomerase
MAAASVRATDRALSPFEQLRLAREVVRGEGQTLLDLADRLGEEFCHAAALLAATRGSVIVSGIGKAGLIGQKISATLASTGTPSHFLHPSEAIHGDLGRIKREDIALILSFSGQTEEVVRMLPALTERWIPIIAVTGQSESPLAKKAVITLDLGPIREACPLNLAPTASTTAMLALGDALAIVVSQMRNFSSADFARYHPGGNLGRRLARVEEAMRPLEQCRVARDAQTLRETLVGQSRPGRRTGAIMIVDEAGKLVGIFTDSDLARLLEANRDQAIDGPLADVMTRSPARIERGELLPAACEILSRLKISELPVVDQDHRPLGLIDITDVVGIDPEPVQSPKSKVGSQRSEVGGRRSEAALRVVDPYQN